MRSDWLLVTFGAGLPNWRAAAKRLGRQASESGAFAQTLVYTERELASEYPDFARQHREVLSARVRGFGYWIWKPYLLWKTLEFASRSGLSGVAYLDAGCELNLTSEAARLRLLNYQQMALRDGVFAMHLAGYPEREWTRLAVMDHFGLSIADRDAPQVQGTPMLPASTDGIALARTWFESCVQDDYFLARDAKKDEVQEPDFRDHRHDQSLFSCLVKTQGIETIPDETFWAPDWANSGRDYPLWAARNRTRVSILDSSPRGQAIRFGERLYSRAYRELSAVRRSRR